MTHMPDKQSKDPLAYLEVGDDSGAPSTVAIFDQLYVGRECAGIWEGRRLVIADPEISDTHLEIRLDTETDRAFVIDTSSNGTLLNGARLERAVPLRIRPGDELRIGHRTMTFRSKRFTAPVQDRRGTRARFEQVAMVMVVGDIVNYSTISQVTDDEVMARSLHTLWHQLRGALHAHHGTLSHYAGDALFAVWEQRQFPQGAGLAIDFALKANQIVDELGPELPLRNPDGTPIRMGWGVVQGVAAVAAMTRSADAVIGDAANVAFRLSGLAGRNGRAAVMVTSGARQAVGAAFTWGEAECVELKGRHGMETVFPVIARSRPTEWAT
jgi:adenylate cyclase